MTAAAAGPGLENIPPVEDEDTVVDVEPVVALARLDIGQALTALEKGQIDIQVATAKTYPRSITTALREAESLACLDEETAETMVYALKRGGKVIDGPSVRLAEVMAHAWGNLRVDADIVGEDKTFVTAMALCWDLEKNVGIRIRVKRRITDSKGRRYNDDMIGVTSNAAISIAVRNAVFRVVPHTLTNRIYRKARVAMLGRGTLAEKRRNLLDHFAKLGVKPEEVFAAVEVKGIDDIMEDQLVILRGFANAIKEGEQSVDTIFRPSRSSEGAAALDAALAKKVESEPKAAPAPVNVVGGKKACAECGAKPGEPHLSQCPYAD